MQPKDLIVIGSSNIDLVISVARIPAIGETVLGGKSSMVFGGKGANQAVAAIRSGADTAFITKVGNDLFGDNLKTHFKDEGFPPELILTDENEPTGVAQIFVSEKGENCIAVAPGANMQLLPKDMVPYLDLIANAKVVLLQLETPLETIAYIVEMARNKEIKIILNPAPAQPLRTEILENIWLLTPNESEASILSGIEVVDQKSAHRAAIRLLEMGIKNVIITLGENGCIFCQEKGMEYFKAFKTNAIDTTAAGDVFNGTLASEITRNKSIEEAIAFATAAAAISVSRKGAQPSIPYREEVENILHES
jgi:ribokinase